MASWLEKDRDKDKDMDALSRKGEPAFWLKGYFGLWAPLFSGI
jgi:hypothetical protein